MVQAHVKDPSTLASLHPSQPRELHYRDYKNSMRLHGSHFMTLKRPSRQAESGREYVPGDPVNLVDWKAYARTDQLIVREIRDEAAARILIGVDVSETMQWPDAAAPAPATSATKAEVAMRLALNLAHIHLRMGDMVELWLVDEGRQKLPAKVLKPRSAADLVSTFDRLLAAGFGREACQAEFRSGDLGERRRDCAFWIGDALGQADFAAVLALGKRSFHLHVLSSLELDIGWVENDTSYFDEGFGRKEYQGQVLKHHGNYAKRLTSWRQKLERQQRQRGGEYLTVSDRTQVVQYQVALAGFLQLAAG